MCAHNGQLGVALTLGAAIPSHAAIQRWFGEPVRAVVVPTTTFQTNKRGFPALPKAHQAVLVSFFQLNVQVGLSCNAVTWCCRLLRMALNPTPFSILLLLRMARPSLPTPLRLLLMMATLAPLWPLSLLLFRMAVASSCCFDNDQQQQMQVGLCVLGLLARVDFVSRSCCSCLLMIIAYSAP